MIQLIKSEQNRNLLEDMYPMYDMEKDAMKEIDPIDWSKKEDVSIDTIIEKVIDMRLAWINLFPGVNSIIINQIIRENHNSNLIRNTPK